MIQANTPEPDNSLVAERADLPLQPMAGRTGLVGEG